MEIIVSVFLPVISTLLPSLLEMRMFLSSIPLKRQFLCQRMCFSAVNKGKSELALWVHLKVVHEKKPKTTLERLSISRKYESQVFERWQYLCQRVCFSAVDKGKSELAFWIHLKVAHEKNPKNQPPLKRLSISRKYESQVFERRSRSEQLQRKFKAL